MQHQPLNRMINRLKKADSGSGIVVEDVLKVTECIKLGIVADEDFNALYAARARRLFRVASAAK